jgi:hypothetical protein
MAKEVLLESDITAGARLIEELDKKGADVSAALWFFYPDLSEWKLLLVSPTFEKNGLTASYTMVSEVISSIGDVNKSISIDNIVPIRLTPKSTRFGAVGSFPRSLDARPVFAAAFWMLP